jgi:hypothetical protein
VAENIAMPTIKRIPVIAYSEAKRGYFGVTRAT